VIDGDVDRTDTARAALLCCLGSTDPDVVAGSLEGLTPADWERLVKKSVCHNVAPLVYRNLKRLGRAAPVPGSALERLREIYEAETVRKLRVYQELARLLETLRKDGVRAIVLKGAHLACAVYGNIGLRPMCDVDILVRKTDLPAARQSLLGIGYGQPQYTPDKGKHLYPFTKAGAIPVEVHWTLETEPEPLVADRDHLRERARPFTFGKSEALGLCPDDLFLHLCFHAAHHGFVLGLQPLCDIVEVVGFYDDRLDWDAIRSRARLWRVSKSVFLTLRLIGDLLGPIVPDSVTDSFDSDRSCAAVGAVASEQIFSIEGDPAARQRRQRPEGVLEKARILLGTLFPPPSTMRLVYQTERVFLTYLIRPFDLFARYSWLGQKLFKRSGRRDRSVGARMRMLHNTNIIRNWILSAPGSAERDD